MAAILNIIGFMMLLFIHAYPFRKRIVQVVPNALATLCLILLFLGMIRRLSWIDHLFALLIVAVIAYVIINRKRLDQKYIRSLYADGDLWVLLSASILLFLMEKERIARAWDELGCWAIEVKTLYFENGFSTAWMHTSVGYADYLPGQMLFEWWVCHMHHIRFYEGLMYVGYYLFYTMLIVSAFSYIKNANEKKILNLLYKFFLVAIFLILPGCVSTFGYEMLSVEFLQSAVVGYLIYMMYLQKERGKIDLFDHIQWTSLTVLLIMLKDSSIFFLLMLYVLAVYLSIFTKKKYCDFLQLVVGGCSAIAVISAWKYFVKASHRGDPLQKSSNMVRLFRDFFKDPFADENTLGYVRSFWQSIVEYPLHITRKFGLNFSVVGVILFICIILYLFYKYRMFDLSKKELLIAEIGMTSMIVLYMVALLGMHMFGFRETQYLDPKTMMYSISRYTEPIIAGLLLFLMITCVTRMSYKAQVIAVFCVILFADHSRLIWAFGKYRENLAGDQMGREMIKSDNAEMFRYFDKMDPAEEGKILLIYDEDTALPNRRILQYLTAPRALYFYLDSQKSDDMQCLSEIKDAVFQNRYTYFYFRSVNMLLDARGIEPDHLYTCDEMTDILREEP